MASIEIVERAEIEKLRYAFFVLVQLALSDSPHLQAYVLYFGGTLGFSAFIEDDESILTALQESLRDVRIYIRWASLTDDRTQRLEILTDAIVILRDAITEASYVQ